MIGDTFIKISYSDIDKIKLEKFKKIHNNHFFESTIGGRYTYSIMQTSLGIFIEIKCNICNESTDISNVDNI